MRKYLFLLLLLLLSSLTYAQKYGIANDSVGNKVAIQELQSGKLISDFLFDNVEIMDQLGIIRNGKKFGLFDVNNGKIYCCDYDRIDDFDSLHYSGQKGIVKKNGKAGIAGLSNDKGLEIILPFKYKSIENSYDASYLFILRKGNKYGIFNLKTREVLPIWVKEPSAIGIQGNYIVIKEKDKYGLFSSNGRKLLPVKYTLISLLCTGSDVFQIYEGEKSGFYDGRIEKLLVEPIEGFLELSEIDNRFYSLYNEEKQTYIDSQTGKPVLSLEYKFTGELHKKRYMPVDFKGKLGIFDFKELNLAVPCIYDDADKLREKEALYFD